MKTFVRRQLVNAFSATTEDDKGMIRIIDELDQSTEDVGLDRKAASNFGREVFKKYADLHLINIFQLRRATATMCHVSSEMVSLVVKPANNFTGVKPVVVNHAAISWTRK